MGRIRLRIKIEKKRKRMQDLSNALGLTDPSVVKVSQQLDELLNNYRQLGRVV